MSDSWINKTLYKNGVLKNKKNITDGKELERIEYQISSEKALILLERQVKVKSVNDLNRIHKYLFQSLYDWAGKDREGDFGKGNTTFFPRERFEYAKSDINIFLDEHNGDKPLSTKDYATLLDKVNFYHPFREGNGRSAKTFIQLFALQHHQVIDYPRYDSGMITALSEANVDQIASYIEVQDTPTLKLAKEQTTNKFKEQYQQYLYQKGLGLDR